MHCGGGGELSAYLGIGPMCFCVLLVRPSKWPLLPFRVGEVCLMFTPPVSIQGIHTTLLDDQAPLT